MFLHWEGSFLTYNTLFAHMKDTERSEILDSIFGQSGLVDSTDRNDFECKAADISTKYPSFSGYFHTQLKDRLYQYVFFTKISVTT